MTALPLEISCGEVHAKRVTDQTLLLLDCREDQEHQISTIDGAHLLPMSELAERHQELETFRDRQIVVYCHHGGRSAQVAQWLRQNGYPDAQSMAGGIDVWAQEIEPGMPRY